MPGDNDRSSVIADIPADAVEEALRSVERLGGAPTEAPAPGEPAAQAPPAEAPAEGGAAAAEGGSREDRLRAELELSQRIGRETMDRLKEEHERLLRAAADHENYKKRAQKERDEVQRFGTERLVKDLIPVLDNLERALAAAPDGDPLAGGVRLVLRGFEETLGRYGVESFSALGQPFDPRLHEALLQVPTSDQPPGTVVLEHGRGYLLNERLVRPAMVGVAVTKGAPQASSSGDASTSSDSPAGGSAEGAAPAEGDGPGSA